MGRFLPIVTGFLVILWALRFLEVIEPQDSEGSDNHRDIDPDCFSLDWYVYKQREIEAYIKKGHRYR